MRKSLLYVLSALLLVSPSEAQHVTTSVAPPLPTYVTQLGDLHFPGGNGSGPDLANAVVALRSGAVLVAGVTYSSLTEPHAGASFMSDAFLARFDPVGSVEWIRQIGQVTAPTIPALNGNAAGPGGEVAGFERVADLAVSADGSIYVTGETTSSLGETNGGREDFFLAKFDKNGTLLWLRQLGAESAGAIAANSGVPLVPLPEDGGTAVLIGRDGGVYVSGYTYGNLGAFNGDGSIGSDVFLARFTNDGRLEWLEQVSLNVSLGPGLDGIEGSDYPAEIAQRADGAIVMAIHSSEEVFGGEGLYGGESIAYVTLLVFDAEGEVIAARALPGTLHEDVVGLAIDASGRIFVAGHTWADLAEPHGDVDNYVACFEADLDLAWIRHIGQSTGASLGLLDVMQDEICSGIRIDAAGDVILAGTTDGSLSERNGGPSYTSDAFAAKLSGVDGTIQWVSQIGATTSALHGLGAAKSEWLGPRGLDLDRHGNIVLTGSTGGSLAEPSAGSSDVIVMRLTPEGEL